MIHNNVGLFNPLHYQYCMGAKQILWAETRILISFNPSTCVHLLEAENCQTLPVVFFHDARIWGLLGRIPASEDSAGKKALCSRSDAA